MQALLEPPARADRGVPTPVEDRAVAITSELTAQRAYLLRYARSRLRDAATAEDVVQDTLLAALQAIERFEQRASLRTWLTGILVNKIADAVRRDQRSGAARARAEGDVDGEALEPIEAPEATEPAGEPADWRDPERVLAARQAADELARKLDGLAPLAQRVFVLREIEGLSNGEAARSLGLTPERGALLLHRTRERLRRGLHEARVM